MHPDKTGNTRKWYHSWEQMNMIIVADAHFAALSQAKEVLSDPEKRKAYNAWRRCPTFMSFEEWLLRKDFIGMVNDLLYSFFVYA
ncbi:DnaJ domain containing protein [Trichuris trichiura]|uniref:DnaJ domain containing protein n=1 Tax=Trichuris trichiura TaxID=36087 RepID=A0A077ZR09_TRITR|nr:DnaJ domain containing protein [Trichuris trichiura]